MDLKHFRAFVAVAETLNFTRAAEVINVSQPTLSMLIRQLEDSVGVRLLNRSTRQVSLTEMGLTLLPMARNVVSGLVDAMDRMQEFAALRRGRVRVAAFPSVAINQLPEILVTYRQSHPDVRVQIMDTVWEQVVDLVRSGRVDFGVGTRPPEMDGLEFRPVYTDTVMLMIPTGHRLTGRTQITWSEIADEEIIVPSSDTGVRRAIDEALADKSMTLNIILEPALIMSIAALVSAGAGLGIILSPYLRAVHGFSGSTAQLAEPFVRREIGVITRANSVMTPAADVLHQMMLDQMQGEPATD